MLNDESFFFCKVSFLFVCISNLCFVCYLFCSMNDYYGFFFVLNWDLLFTDVVWAYCGAISVFRFCCCCFVYSCMVALL